MSAAGRRTAQVVFLVLCAVLALAGMGGGARAQSSGQTVNVCVPTGPGGTNCPNVTPSAPFPVTVISGGGSGLAAASFASAFPGGGIAIGVKNGANMVNLAADASSNLLINCAVGCAGGTNSNATSAVATSSTNGASNSWLYGFNGTTWDQLQADGSKNLKVVLPANAAINVAQENGVTPLMGNGVSGTGSRRVNIASDNTAFTVNAAQSGSWTNTVTQATGTNLHIVCDSGCSTSTAPGDEATFTPGTTSQTPIGGMYQTTATSNPMVSGQMGAVQITINRAMMTNLRNAVGVEVGTAATPLQVSLANTGVNGTALAVSLAANQSVNVAQINGVTPLMGAGATGTGAQRVTAAQDGTTIAGSPPGTAGTASTSVVTIQGIAAMTPLLVTPAANSAINEAQINGTTPDMNTGNATAGTQRVVLATNQPALTNPLLTSQQPATSGGLSTFYLAVLANTTSVAVKASAGQLYDLDAFGIAAAAPVFIKLYDAAQGSVACGTPTPKYVLMIPASGGAPGSGFVKDWPNGMTFATAITACITAGISNNDTTAPAASTYVANFAFK